MFSINTLEFQRFQTIVIQRSLQTTTLIMLSFKNQSVLQKKFSCFILDPKKWKKKVTRIFYFDRKFHIILWKESKRKFSGFIPGFFSKTQSYENLSGFLVKLTSLFSETDLPIFDGFLQFRNKSIKVLPVQTITENLWVSFSVFRDFSHQIKKQSKLISKNLRKIYSNHRKLIKRLCFSQESGKFYLSDLSEDFFLDLIFRRRI